MFDVKIPKRPKKLKLGAIARDTITGYQGTIVCVATWLNGCHRITIQSPTLKDGIPVDNVTFDDQQLELVKTVEHEADRTTGGPRNDPPRI